MKKLWPLVLLVIALPPIYSQEVKHAPTVEQCRADQRLWLAKVEEPEGAGLRYVTYRELGGWFHEMHECETVDPDFKLSYYNTASEITTTQWERVYDFLDRHNLYDQFIAEDAQGKR